MKSLDPFKNLSISYFADGVREVLGRKVKLAIKRMVRMEIKLDKYENKVLVSTN